MKKILLILLLLSLTNCASNKTKSHMSSVIGATAGYGTCHHMLNDMGFPNFQKGEPINNLMREIKRSIKKQKKQEDFGWKDFWEFWPLSIVVPLMLLSIIIGPMFQ